MIEPLTIRLPMPPSINGAYLNVPGRGRVATKALRTWKAAAGASVRLVLAGVAQRPVFGGRVDVALRVPIPANGRNRDGDNCLKAVLDALVAGGVIADDNWRRVRMSSVEWIEDDLGGDCLVTVTQIADAPAERPQGGRTASKAISGLHGQPRIATRQRRASQRQSAKVASDAAVMRELAEMGVQVAPGRVHVTGGRRP